MKKLKNLHFVLLSLVLLSHTHCSGTKPDITFEIEKAIFVNPLYLTERPLYLSIRNQTALSNIDMPLYNATVALLNTKGLEVTRSAMGTYYRLTAILLNLKKSPQRLNLRGLLTSTAVGAGTGAIIGAATAGGDVGKSAGIGVGIGAGTGILAFLLARATQEEYWYGTVAIELIYPEQQLREKRRIPVSFVPIDPTHSLLMTSALKRNHTNNMHVHYLVPSASLGSTVQTPARKQEVGFARVSLYMLEEPTYYIADAKKYTTSAVYSEQEFLFTSATQAAGIRTRRSDEVYGRMINVKHLDTSSLEKGSMLQQWYSINTDKRDAYLALREDSSEENSPQQTKTMYQQSPENNIQNTAVLSAEEQTTLQQYFAPNPFTQDTQHSVVEEDMQLHRATTRILFEIRGYNLDNLKLEEAIIQAVSQRLANFF